MIGNNSNYIKDALCHLLLILLGFYLIRNPLIVDYI